MIHFLQHYNIKNTLWTLNFFLNISRGFEGKTMIYLSVPLKILFSHHLYLGSSDVSSTKSDEELKQDMT